MKHTTRLFYTEPESIFTEAPCLFWGREPDHDFVQNLKAVGQIEPVIVFSQKKRLTLVAGFKRSRALAEMGQKILALQVQPQDPYMMGMIYLASNSGQALDSGKTAAALRYFSSINRITPSIWKSLDITHNSKAQELWQQWLELPQIWDELLAKGNLCLDCSHLLTKFTPQEQEAVRPLFTCLGWSRNNSLKFLTWTWELTKITRNSVFEILESSGVNRILHSDLSPGDKIKSIMKNFYQIRFPQSSAKLSKLSENLRRMSRETGWRMEHTDNFETMEISISTRIKNQDELHKAIAKLQTLADSRILDNWPVKLHE